MLLTGATEKRIIDRNPWTQNMTGFGVREWRDYGSWPCAILAYRHGPFCEVDREEAGACAGSNWWRINDPWLEPFRGLRLCVNLVPL